MDKIRSEEAEAQETINLLLNEKEESVCDSTSDSFNNQGELPPFYDEEKFKRGQDFFHKHIFAMLVAKLLGLVTVISTPNILNILIFTKKSSEAMTAYKRYMATILHMCVWYRSDFKPGSQSWKSIVEVKNMHNSTSKRSCAMGNKAILQRDMAITQFGFMGYIITCPELIGIHNATKDELEGFIHLWRVVGYVMGIEDKYNVCKSSIQQTKNVCEALIQGVFIPNIRKQNPDYLKLADALITGMWVMQPMLQTRVYMSYLYILLNKKANNNENKLPCIELNRTERFNLALLKGYMYYLKYTILRWYSNTKMWVSFWLMKNFPFLAYYKYGYENSHVTISVEINKTCNK